MLPALKTSPIHCTTGPIDDDDACAGVSPNLLFEWAMPILSGQGIAGWKHLDVGVQCWVLVALKEGLAAADMHVLHQHALAVLALCHNLLKSEATSVHLIAPIMGLVSEVSIVVRGLPHACLLSVCSAACTCFITPWISAILDAFLLASWSFYQIENLPALYQQSLCCWCLS